MKKNQPKPTDSSLRWLKQSEADFNAAKDSMHKLCRIDIESRERVYEELEEFVKELRSLYTIYHVYLFGSAAENALHEGSDIDLIIVGDFKERFFRRIANVLGLTSLPIEPLVYTKEEFEAMKQGPFIQEVLKNAQEL